MAERVELAQVIGQLRQELSAVIREVRARTCGSSSARWSWSLTGGDALAFTEINTAQQLIRAQPNPNLTSVALPRSLVW